MEAAKGIAILIIAAFLGLNFYQDIQNQKEVVTVKTTIAATANNTVATLDEMQQQIDSLHTHIGKLATATVYLDSCQQQKAAKAERAERRGKFIGGLLKGLLPF
jgi:uncharacterized protein HemX